MTSRREIYNLKQCFLNIIVMIMALFKIDIILEVFINRKNVHGLTEIRKTKCNTTLRLDKLKWHYILSNTHPILLIGPDTNYR